MFYLVVGLIVVAGIIIYKRQSQSKKKLGGDVEDLAGVGITDAVVGDIVVIAGLGDDYDDQNFLIERIHRYESDKGEWFELVCGASGRQVWIEWENDDELVITASVSRDAKNIGDIGLTEEMLVRFDNEASKSNGFKYDGSQFFYCFSGEAGYFKDSKKEVEEFYIWDFMSEDMQETITVEKWEGEPFELFLGEIIPTYNVTVFKR